MSNETLAEEGRKYQENKEAKAQKFVRCNEIKVAISRLEAERKSLQKSSPEAEVLKAQWTVDVEYLVKEFVSELSGRVRDGGPTKIRFDSQAAMVYLNADRWLAAIPELAERVAGSTNRSGRSIAGINGEIMALRCELNDLGGS